MEPEALLDQSSKPLVIGIIPVKSRAFVLTGILISQFRPKPYTHQQGGNKPQDPRHLFPSWLTTEPFSQSLFMPPVLCSAAASFGLPGAGGKPELSEWLSGGGGVHPGLTHPPPRRQSNAPQGQIRKKVPVEQTEKRGNTRSWKLTRKV